MYYKRNVNLLRTVKLYNQQFTIANIILNQQIDELN